MLLLLVAVIWGFGFVAQRAAMDHIGPFTYNGVRFLLGGFCLIPFARRENTRPRLRKTTINPWLAGLAAGVVLFGGAALQQTGIQYTTAGKAGFITGLYVVLVPIFALLLGRRTGSGTWLGAFLSVAGLYLLSVQENFSMQTGDLLVLLGAVFWALHVLILGYLSPRTCPLRLARDQFFCCALLSLITAFFIEQTSIIALYMAALPILFGGVVSVGAGYTLQVVAQQKAKSSHAAIILSLETVFGAMGGWLFLDEHLSNRAVIGCGLMLTGMLCSQILQRNGYSR